jgi:hypothetical protein
MTQRHNLFWTRVILNMKFGLTGYVNAEFTNETMQEAKEPTAITLFSEDGMRALSLPLAGRRERVTFMSSEISKAK